VGYQILDINIFYSYGNVVDSHFLILTYSFIEIKSLFMTWQCILQYDYIKIIMLNYQKYVKHFK